ncbi:MAG: AhpC/TSA family protein [Chitinophagaceae bacterium]|nr:AhpC/TSA family protein [Chitinophagaceae bacterium]
MKQLFASVLVLLFAVSLHAQGEPKGLEVNDKAPVFIAKDQEGKSVSLSEQLKKGPVVLVFYRGQWCPYCNRYLKSLEDSLSLVTQKGATLIAVSPEKPESIAQTIEKTKATYPILFDEGLQIMKSYDVTFAVDEKTIERYKGYGIDFIKTNGETNGARLPVPAVYVINKEGMIIYRHFDKNYTRRPPVAEILRQL